MTVKVFLNYKVKPESVLWTPEWHLYVFCTSLRLWNNWNSINTAIFSHNIALYMEDPPLMEWSQWFNNYMLPLALLTLHPSYLVPCSLFLGESSFHRRFDTFLFDTTWSYWVHPRTSASIFRWQLNYGAGHLETVFYHYMLYTVTITP